MKKYIVTGAIQCNIGYDTNQEIFNTYDEAQYRMEELANEFIQDKITDLNMLPSQRDLYMEEVNDTRGYSNSLDYVGDPDGEWYVSIDEADMKE